MDETLSSLEGVPFCLDRLCGSGFEVAIPLTLKCGERPDLYIMRLTGKGPGVQRPHSSLRTVPCQNSLTSKVQSIVMGSTGTGAEEIVVLGRTQEGSHEIERLGQPITQPTRYITV